jgi:hypothetical protein
MHDMAGAGTRLRIGLVAQALTYGGLLLGRLASVALDGIPPRITIALALAESLGVILALVALRRLQEPVVAADHADRTDPSPRRS